MLPIVYQCQDCDDIFGWYHVFNGLVWEWNKITGNEIESFEVEKIATYWTQVIVDKKNPQLDRDFETISGSLKAKMDSKFPCKKEYENNSLTLKSDSLIKMLSRPTRVSDLSETLTSLGNDSTQSFYKDCFYIAFDADGVTFRFDNDSTLTSIFIKEPFNGEIPYQIKLTDNKTAIEKRFGKPNKEFAWSGHVSVSYPDKLLYMDFDERGRMTNFYLSRE